MANQSFNLTVSATILSTLLFSVGANAFDENSVQVPDGYIKTDTRVKGNITTHIFEKPSPEKATPVQNADQTFARYIDALPENEREIGKEFKTLVNSLQNAQMYSEITKHIAQGVNNEARIEEARQRNRKQEAESKSEKIVSVSETQMVLPKAKEAIKVEHAVSSKDEKKPDVETITPSVIDSVELSGIYSIPSGKDFIYNARINLNGISYSIRPGSLIQKTIDVVDVSKDGVHLKEGKLERFISVMDIL